MLFGGGSFDAALNAKFKAGHALPIDVLKNPTETSLYGVRGGNGVIVITTRRPKSG